jgi:hypothetical protein
VHDLDRTLFEAGELASEYESEFEGEFEGEQAFETVAGGLETMATGELGETMELELASELLEVASEQELEQFLGSLMSRAVGGAKAFVASPAGRQLKALLRQAAKRALPVVGRAAGEWIRPGAGAAGARMASGVGRMFGLELEGLSQEDQEFEVARGFVRFAADAARRAAVAPRAAPPTATVRSALTGAARRHAPGLVSTGARGRGHRSRGRWVRRGNTIVITGI